MKSVVIKVASIRWDEKATIEVAANGDIVNSSDWNIFRGKLKASAFSPDHKRWVAHFGEGGFSVASFVSETNGWLLANILEAQQSTKAGRAKDAELAAKLEADEKAVYRTIGDGRA